VLARRRGSLLVLDTVVRCRSGHLFTCWAQISEVPVEMRLREHGRWDSHRRDAAWETLVFWFHGWLHPTTKLLAEEQATALIE